MEECPVCGSGIPVPEHPHGDYAIIDCPRCGIFKMSGSGIALLKNNNNYSQKTRNLVSHFIRKMSVNNELPYLDTDVLRQILDLEQYPSVAEQADNLIFWMGKRQRSIGDQVIMDSEEYPALVGCAFYNDLKYLIEGQVSAGLISDFNGETPYTARLSFKGWQHFEDLKKGKHTGHYAFMAMKFEDSFLDELYRTRFKNSVKETGFDLRTVSERPEAGSITNRMIVEIRNCRFLIADLTHDNSGAYWEAGYAEGLGKPVIYTCDAAIFNENGTHFDVNHHQTIQWDRDNLDQFVRDLKACIRVTIPEAKQEDEK